MHGILDFVPANFFPALAVGFLVMLLNDRRAITKALVVGLLVSVAIAVFPMLGHEWSRTALFFVTFGLPLAVAGALAGSFLATVVRHATRRQN